MLCEHYKDALIEAAASGAAPSGELREHLAECASCRAVFGQEQSLFAAIDTGLHAAANAKIPPSLLPGVRARLDEVAAPRFRWVQPLVFASTGVALGLVVFVMARLYLAGREEMAKKGPVAVPALMATATNTNRQETSPESTQIAAVPVNHTRASRNSTDSHSETSSNPEVLVPPDEREAFARLVGVLNQRSDVVASLLAKVPEKPDGLAAVDPLQIPDIEIKPLEGTETETSDGAGEKHSRMIEQEIE
jgi:hypothetical protein